MFPWWIFDDQFCRRYILKYLRTLVGCEFWEWVFHYSSKTHFKHGIPIWALVWENLLSPVVKQTQTHRSCFYLNNRLNVLLNLKENCTLKYAFSWKTLQLFGRTSDMPVIYEKAKSVCFIYMQTQKVKFKFVFVQINMKQVSYNFTCKRLSIAYFR